MERNKRTKGIQVQTSAIDLTTGEILANVSNFTTIKTEKEPDFVKLYLSDIVRLNELPKSYNGILHELLKCMTYENKIFLNRYMREQVAKKLNTTQGYVYKSIGKLINLGLFLRLGSNTYLVNPDVFGKGTWSDVRKIRMTITYDKSGKMCLVERENSVQTDNLME